MSEAGKVRKALLRSKMESDGQIDRIRRTDPLSFEVLEECMTEYVLAKFMLTREECEGVDFQKLSELSLSKSMEISPELVKEFDTARSCAGATSEIAKKTLLYMSIQKALQIELQAELTPKIRDFRGLAQLVWEGMERTEFWRPRLKADPA